MCSVIIVIIVNSNDVIYYYYYRNCYYGYYTYQNTDTDGDNVVNSKFTWHLNDRKYGLSSKDLKVEKSKQTKNSKKPKRKEFTEKSNNNSSKDGNYFLLQLFIITFFSFQTN